MNWQRMPSWNTLCILQPHLQVATNTCFPRGTAFAPHSPMRGDALYMHLIGENDELYKRMEELVKANYEQLYPRLQGFSFFITEKQLQTLPLKFRSGSAERLLDIMRQLRSPLYPMIAGIVSEDYLFFTTSQ